MPYTAEQIRSRHPFELFFVVIVLLTSIGGLLSDRVRPGSVQEGVGHGGTLAWYIALLVGGLVALAGIYWRDRATGLIMEAVGLVITGGCTVFYALAALLLIGSGSVYPAMTLLAYGAAAIWRAGQIYRLLSRVTRRHTVNDEE